MEERSAVSETNRLAIARHSTQQRSCFLIPSTYTTMPHTVLLTGANRVRWFACRRTTHAPRRYRSLHARSHRQRHHAHSRVESLGSTGVIRGDLTDVGTRNAPRKAAMLSSAECREGWRLGARQRIPQGERRGASQPDSTASAAALYRFVHVSTLGVVRAPCHYATDENQNRCPTTACRLHAIEGGGERRALFSTTAGKTSPITILRAGFVYGPRDRTVLPRIVERLKERSVIYICARPLRPEHDLRREHRGCDFARHRRPGEKPAWAKSSTSPTASSE